MIYDDSIMIIMHKMVKELLRKNVEFYKDDYDDYFDEDGRVATSTSDGSDYHDVLEKYQAEIHSLIYENNRGIKQGNQ